MKEKAVAALPCAALLLGLASLFWFAGDRGHFHRHHFVDWVSARAMAQAAGLQMVRGFAVQVVQTKRRPDGAIGRVLYQRYPVAGYALVKFATAPFPDSLAARLQVARLLMLAFLAAAAALAYCCLARLTGSRWLALGATLLAFSSYRVLNTGPMVSNEGSVGLFAVLLVFHGMVVFAQRGRFWTLLAKTCVALLFSWHVYGVLLAFVAVGLVGGVLQAWRSPPARARTAPWAWRVARAVGVALRGRPALLGLVALLFGGGVLAYNFAGEAAALRGEGYTANVAELPLAGSMARRLGQDASFNAAKDWFLAWPAFLELQLHRIGGLCVPFALPGLPTTWNDQPAARIPAGGFLVGAGVLALIGSFLGVLLAPRHRALFATLVLSGFCWTLPMRHMTGDPEHTFETVFWLGVPLVFFTALLAGVRALARRAGRRRGGHLAWGGPVCAAAALAIFVWSSARMGGVERDGAFAGHQRAVMAEFDAIRRHVAGGEVLVAIHRDALLPLGGQRHAFWYFLSGSVLHYGVGERADQRAADYVLSRTRVPSESLLTPQHQFAFLYDSVAGLEEITAEHRRRYRALAAAPPTVRAPFNLHLRADRVTFTKDACSAADIAGRFFLHVAPVSPTELALADRRQGFEHLDFWFGEHGVRFDGKCMAEVPLPDYEVATVYAGRLASGAGPVVWRASYRTPAGLRALSRWRDAPGRLLARSVFDVRLVEGEGVLTFVRNPCVAEDVRARFFLHIFPAELDDLPPGGAGFDNRDFAWDERGALLAGGCVAAVPLPEYEVARVRAGQWGPDGALWREEFALGG